MMKTLLAGAMTAVIVLACFQLGRAYERAEHRSLYVIAEESARLPRGTIFSVIAEEEGPYYLTPPIKIFSPPPTVEPARDPLIQRNIEPGPKLTEPNTNPAALNSEGKATIGTPIPEPTYNRPTWPK